MSYFSDYYYFEDEVLEMENSQNKECLECLIEALYNDDKELNTELISEQLFVLAQNYNIKFDDSKPLQIQKKPKEKSDIFRLAEDLIKAEGEYLTQKKEQYYV